MTLCRGNVFFFPLKVLGFKAVNRIHFTNVNYISGLVFIKSRYAIENRLNQNFTIVVHLYPVGLAFDIRSDLHEQKNYAIEPLKCKG